MLKQLGLKQIDLLQLLNHQYGHLLVSESLVSRWLSGKRDPKPYLREIVQVLKEDLKRTYGNGRAAQEIVDWYTLLGRQRGLKEDDMQRWFPGFPAPIVAGNFPRFVETSP